MMKEKMKRKGNKNETKLAWSKDYIDFKLVKIHDNKTVRVHSSQTNYLSITISDGVKDARWSGDTILMSHYKMVK
jgi:hypothetical protein